MELQCESVIKMIKLGDSTQSISTIYCKTAFSWTLHSTVDSFAKIVILGFV